MAKPDRGLKLVSKKGVAPEPEIGELYKLPLGEFTTARNALAKQLGATDPPIKSLEKPSLPAWAVNQLYWRERAAYDHLIAASERLRAEHRSLLAGKASNIREAELAHREAIRTATEKVRAILAESNEASSPATIAAIGETLDALPSADPPGRLTRPLKPGGFETLTGVPPRSTAAPGVSRKSVQKPRVTAATDPAALRREAAAREREAEAARREAAKEKERLLADARRAQLALEKAQAAVTRAEQEVERREKALADARKNRDRLRDDAAVALSEYQRATRRAHE